MRVLIERITRQNKYSEKINSRTGQVVGDFEIIGIQNGGSWINGADFDGWTSDWKDGMSVEVDVYEEEFNGKMYKKFRKLNKTNALEERVRILEDRLDRLDGTSNVQVTGHPSYEDIIKGVAEKKEKTTQEKLDELIGYKKEEPTKAEKTAMEELPF